MFQSGTYVVYGCKGVHKILGTTGLNLEGQDEYAFGDDPGTGGDISGCGGAYSRIDLQYAEAAGGELQGENQELCSRCLITGHQDGNGEKGRKSKTRKEAYPSGYAFYGAGGGYIV